VAKVRAGLTKDGKVNGRDVVHKREVLASHSHLGTRSFVSSYAKISAETMGHWELIVCVASCLGTWMC
jgi:hypothetical protein